MGRRQKVSGGVGTDGGDMNYYRSHKLKSSNKQLVPEVGFKAIFIFILFLLTTGFIWNKLF